MKNRSRLWAARIISLILFGVLLAATLAPAEAGLPPESSAKPASAWDWGPPIPSDRREWTILVYMDGDNDLEPYALEKIKEMERGFQDSGAYDVVLLLDRARGHSKDFGDWTEARAYRIRHSDAPGIIGSELLAAHGELNMADPQNLERFIRTAAAKFPAKKTALVLWDHGSGWAGLLYDEDAPGKRSGDSMTLEECRQVMERTAPLLPERKFSLIQFDMCLMGQAETVAACAPCAEYLLASAPSEPSDTMDYELLLPLFGRGLETRDIAGNIVDAAARGFEKHQRQDYALTAFDLSQAEPFLRACENCFHRLLPLAAKHWNDLTRVTFYAQNYGGAGDYKRAGKAFSSVDLLDWLERLKGTACGAELRQEIEALESAASTLILKTKNGPAYPRCGGLSFYAPLRGENYSRLYANTRFDAATGWSPVLKALHGAQKRAPAEAPRVDSIDFGSPMIREGVRTPRGGADYRLVKSGSLTPLSGNDLRGSYVKLGAEGENILWAYIVFAYGDSPGGDFKRVFAQVLFDENLDPDASKTTAGTPVFKDGRTELLYQFAGLLYKFCNGTDSVLVGADLSNVADLSSITFGGFYSDPATGGEIPVQVSVNAQFNMITSVLSVKTNFLGVTTVTPVTPREDGLFRPEIQVQRADGTVEKVKGDSLRWGTNPFLINELPPRGSYVKITGLVESLSGLGASMTSPAIPVDENALIAPFVETTLRDGFDHLTGRYAVVAPVPLKGSEGFVMAPTGESVEYSLEESPRGSETFETLTAADGTSQKYPLRINVKGLPAIMTVAKDSRGLLLSTLRTHHAVRVPMGGSFIWRLIDARSGRMIHLIPLDPFWYPQGFMKGRWIGGDGSELRFGDSSFSLIQDGALLCGTYKAQGQKITLKPDEQPERTLFAAWSPPDEKLAATFAESARAVIYTRASDASEPQAPPSSPPPAVPPQFFPVPPLPPLVPQPDSFTGTWLAWYGGQITLCFEENRYSLWHNGQLTEQGTYYLRGSVFGGVTSQGFQFRNFFRMLDAAGTLMTIDFGTGGTALFQKVQ